MLRPLALLALAALWACGDAPTDAPAPVAAPVVPPADPLEDALARWNAAFDAGHEARGEYVDDGIDGAILVLRGIVNRVDGMQKQMFPEDAAKGRTVESTRAEHQLRTMLEFNRARLRELRLQREAARRPDALRELASIEVDATADASGGEVGPAPEASNEAPSDLAARANDLATELHSTLQNRAIWGADVELLEGLLEDPSADKGPEWIRFQLDAGREKVEQLDERAAEQRRALDEARGAYARAARIDRARDAYRRATTLRPSE